MRRTRPKVMERHDWYLVLVLIAEYTGHRDLALWFIGLLVLEALRALWGIVHSYREVSRMEGEIRVLQAEKAMLVKADLGAKGQGRGRGYVC